MRAWGARATIVRKDINQKVKMLRETEVEAPLPSDQTRTRRGIKLSMPAHNPGGLTDQALKEAARKETVPATKYRPRQR